MYQKSNCMIQIESKRKQVPKKKLKIDTSLKIKFTAKLQEKIVLKKILENIEKIHLKKKELKRSEKQNYMSCEKLHNFC